MRRRGKSQLTVLLAAPALLLSIPALGVAASGGGGLNNDPPHSSGSSTNAVPAGRVSASAGGLSITTSSTGFLSRNISFSGSAPARDAGQTVEIERSGRETQWTWAPTVSARVGRNGSFTATWHANHIGQFAIRAVLSRGGGGGTAASAWPTVTVIVYRPALTTWYNQNGSRTACGVMLRPNTIGVAHRTLPCGTKVAFYYHGSSMVVPVIDRGPYGRPDFDLTEAAAARLGMKSAGIATVWSVSLTPHR